MIRKTTAAAVALTFCVAAPVNAAEDEASSDTTLWHDLAAVSSGSSLSSTGSSINAAATILEGLGSSDIELPASSVYIPSTPPPAVDPSIVVPEVVGVRAEGRLEEWSVASPSMGRVVTVQVFRAADAAQPAPMLYLLDGVETPHPSDWLGAGRVPELMKDEQVTVVMPTGARASMWADWYADDPVTGRNRWETFLTQELPPLLERDVPFNGHRAIGGISMGATGALAIANRHSDMFDATFGLSGCYSTSTPLGYLSSRLTVETRGGDVDNLYGPRGNASWEHYDTQLDPSGLKDMTVYLSSARGNVDRTNDEYQNYPYENFVVGIALEESAYHCTRELERELRDQGTSDLQADYAATGQHDWGNFRRYVEPAWEHIKPALY